MVPNLSEVQRVLEGLAPRGLAEPWDNPGLQVGDPDRRISGILVSLDPTLAAVREASGRGAQLLISHHPLIFRPISSLDMGSFPGDVIGEAVRGGVSVVSLHTNLDSAEGGINDILAGLLDLRDVEVLEKKAGNGMARQIVPAEANTEATGLGRVGNLPEPVPLTVMKTKVMEALGAKRPLRQIGDGKDMVRRVAVVGGAGGSLVAQAVERGADILVTGDVTYHQALEAVRLGLTIIDGGHFLTERAAMRVFAERLKAVFVSGGWEVRVTYSEEERSPFDGGFM
jgi:dinuclear metal center YbgI/SA1388 family protein